MKARLALVIVAVLAAAAASDSLTPYQEQTLTPIDTSWSKTQLESVPAPYTVTQANLQQIAADGSASPAFRLRAIHALSTYCAVMPGQSCPDTDPAHQTLVGVIAANGSAQSGANLLILRGAIESIGLMKDPNDEGTLADLLNHPSRDIRATAALALGALCNSAAMTPLHQRLTNESTDQVKLAISAALRMLPPSTTCPVN